MLVQAQTTTTMTMIILIVITIKFAKKPNAPCGPGRRNAFLLFQSRQHNDTRKQECGLFHTTHEVGRMVRCPFVKRGLACSPIAL